MSSHMRASLACLMSVGLALAPTAASAKPKPVRATFLGNEVYTLAGGCEKLKALAAGTPRSLTTVPESLSASGFDGWEGGCAFRRITEVKKGALYKATLACGEAADEWTETDTFALSADRATVTVTVLGKSRKTSVFQRCDVPVTKPSGTAKPAGR